jgi:hypothetical protein
VVFPAGKAVHRSRLRALVRKLPWSGTIRTTGCSPKNPHCDLVLPMSTNDVVCHKTYPIRDGQLPLRLTNAIAFSVPIRQPRGSCFAGSADFTPAILFSTPTWRTVRTTGRRTPSVRQVHARPASKA